MGLFQPDVGHGDRGGQSRLIRDSKAITVHCLEHAAAAVAAAAGAERPLLLLSAPSAAGYAGPAWFAALADAAHEAAPTAEILPILDCGDRAGYALAALRHGLPGIRYNGAATERVRALAEAHGAILLTERPDSLDLADYDDRGPEALAATCRAWLDVKG